MTNETVNATAKVSIVIAIGENTTVDPQAIVHLVSVVNTYDDAELVVVDDMCPEHLRAALSVLRGKVRVLHANPAYGSKEALSVGVALSTGSIVILSAPDVMFDARLLDALLEPFADDPGIGLVMATMRYQSIPPHVPAPVVPPLIALRRNAIDSIGGCGALSAMEIDEVDASATKGSLIDGALLGEFLSAGWRQQQIAYTIEHLDGMIELWSRDPANLLRATQRPYWIPPFFIDTPRPGLNIVGLLEAACGLGTAARRYTDAIARAHIDHATFSYHGHNSPDLSYEHRDGTTFSFDTNFIALNPDLLSSLCARAGREVWAPGQYTIGLWFWELEELSPLIKSGLAYVNELWASSSFMAQAFATATDKPVTMIPLPVPYRSGSPTRSRSSLGMPDKFTFLSIFDFGSIAERKNSIGAVRAFCQAFSPDEGPALVLKTLNSAWDMPTWEELQTIAESRPDIYIINGYVDDEVISDMTGSADCFVSLHKAEGFGLTPAEAMAWGRPVIATDYSGNLDFMNVDNSFLVPFDFVPVNPRLASIYPSSAQWAEPRLDIAARLMRYVYEHPEAALARGLRGQRDIRRTHGLDTVSKIIATRMEEISHLRGRRHSDAARSQRHRQLVGLGTKRS